MSQGGRGDLLQLCVQLVEAGVVRRDVVVGQLMQHDAEQPAIVAEHIPVAGRPEAKGDAMGAAAPAAVIHSLLRMPHNVS